MKKILDIFKSTRILYRLFDVGQTKPKKKKRLI